MKKNSLPISFALAGIETLEFAIIKEAYKKDNDTLNISFNSEFGIKSKSENEIACAVELSFRQDKIPFLKAKLACLFSINKESWEAAFDSKTNSLIFPKNFSDHLNALTLSTLRGFIHAKTDGTEFNRFFVPTINIVELGDSDLIIYLND